ncbi:exonuclease II Exo2 [Balamuthia mandrillaris]
MNGIIHNCTHPDWNDNVLNPLTEKEMTLAIFQYIDRLFHTIKPRKLIYMAIDGVAPRAKMNQQRQRRFKSAKDAQEALEQALAKGEKMSDGERFDSNVITPGTKFMARLSTHLKFFIRKKVKEDRAWRQVTVIFSGHEVPGEGEHKIMSYLRSQKARPDYNPNERHCLYGLDADLIMLALVTHDPNFALLREEVTFGRNKKRSNKLNPASGESPTKFQLLYINLLREYLDREFRATELPFAYDLERVIDDFVLMCFFVGNDFLPHLPYLDIADGALDKMFEIYRKSLPSLGGYITNAGEIDWQRCETFLSFLAQNEKEMLSLMPPLHLDVLEKSILGGDECSDSDYDTDEIDEGNEAEEDAMVALSNRAKALGALKPHSGGGEEISDHDDHDELQAALAELEVDDDEEEDTSENGISFPHKSHPLSKSPVALLEESPSTAARKAHKSRATRAAEEAEDEDEEQSWKNWYYKEKFRVSCDDTEFHENLRQKYLEGIMWVIKYYYNGCVSWSWFYPYHYAPLCSDLTNLASYEFKFEKGTPFLPFQQLMGVFPPASKQALPPCYQDLMTNPQSPILEYYPEEFSVDMNGKKNPWEGIALIPFIDQNKLLEAIAGIDTAKLTEEEQRRNSFGMAYRFRFDPDIQEPYPSSMPDYFLDLVPSMTRCEAWEEPVLKDEAVSPFRWLPSTRVGVEGPPAFPTLDSMKHTGSLVYAGVSIFGSNSRKQSLIIRLPSAGPPQQKQQHQREEEEAYEEHDGEEEEEEESTEEQSTDKGDDMTHDMEQLANELLGKVVYVQWPHLHEALVLGISDSKCRASKSHGCVFHSNEDAQAWQKESKYQKNKYRAKRGIEVGDVKVLLHVKLMRGLRSFRDGSSIRVWNQKDEIFPLQTILREHPNPNPKTQEVKGQPIQEEFPIGAEGVYIGRGPAFGGIGKVLGYVLPPSAAKKLIMKAHKESTKDKDKEKEDKEEKEEVEDDEETKQKNEGREEVGPEDVDRRIQELGVNPKKVKVKIEVEVPPPVPTFGRRIAVQLQDRYYQFSEASRKLDISPKVLSKVTASVYTQYENRKVNIGLRIKFTRKNQMVLGYTQRIMTEPATATSQGRGYWLLSAKAVELVREYKDKFPELFDSMERDDAQEIEVFAPEELFPSEGTTAVDKVRQIEEWLRSLEPKTLVPVGSLAMTNEMIKAVEEEANQHVANAKQRKQKKVILTVNRQLLLHPMEEVPTTPESNTNLPSLLPTPLSSAHPPPSSFLSPSPLDAPSLEALLPALGDRVMSLRSTGPVPFGLNGTVVGIVLNMLEIVFDEQFLGGTDLNHRCSELRGQAHVSPMGVVNLSRGPVRRANVGAATGAAATGQQHQGTAWRRTSHPPLNAHGGGAYQQQQHGHNVQRHQHGHQQGYRQSGGGLYHDHPASQQERRILTRNTAAGGVGGATNAPVSGAPSHKRGGGRGGAEHHHQQHQMYRPKGSGQTQPSSSAAVPAADTSQAPAGGRAAGKRGQQGTNAAGVRNEGNKGKRGQKQKQQRNTSPQPQEGTTEASQQQQLPSAFYVAAAAAAQQQGATPPVGGYPQPPHHLFMPPMFYPQAGAPGGPAPPMFMPPFGYPPMPPHALYAAAQQQQDGVASTGGAPALNWQQQALLGMNTGSSSQQDSAAATSSSTSSSQQVRGGRKGGNRGGAAGGGRRRQHNGSNAGDGAASSKTEQEDVTATTQGVARGGGGRGNRGKQHWKKRSQNNSAANSTASSSGDGSSSSNNNKKGSKDELTWQQKLLM